MIRTLFFTAAGFLALAFAPVCKAQGQCFTSAPVDPPNQWVLWKLSGAFLQIFRTQRVACSGVLQSWTFRTGSIANKSLPIFSVWEQSKDAKGNLRFMPVGTTNIKANKLEAQGGGWYRYRLLPDEQFPVDATRLQFLGIFYENLTPEDQHVTIEYLSPPQSFNVKTFQKWENSTLVGSMALAQIIGNMTLGDGLLPLNPNYINHDMRVPYFQAFIGQPVTTTLKPTAADVTTRKRRPPTTPPPKEMACYGPVPEIENGKAAKLATGYVDEEVPYQCDSGYVLTVSLGVLCTRTGEWIGAPTCKQSQTACYFPLRVGACNQVVPKWYYEKTDASCRPFFYSGCAGNANKFDSVFECYSVCGSIPPPVSISHNSGRR